MPISCHSDECLIWRIGCVLIRLHDWGDWILWQLTAAGCSSSWFLGFLLCLWRTWLHQTWIIFQIQIDCGIHHADTLTTNYAWPSPTDCRCSRRPFVRYYWRFSALHGTLCWTDWIWKTFLYVGLTLEWNSISFFLQLTCHKFVDVSIIKILIRVPN